MEIIPQQGATKMCNLCGVVCHVVHDGVLSDRGHRFDIFECSSCGFQQKASEISHDLLVEEVYGNLSFIEKRASADNSRPERDYIGDYVDGLGGPRAVLEVGPGAGGNLNYAKQRGHQCFSLDVSDDNNAYFAATFGWDGVYRSFEEIEDESFDVIILTHVIEHVEYPLPFLNEVYRVLSPNGEIILSTPNGSSLWSRVLGRRWWMYAIDDHFSFFRPRHFHWLASELGIETVRIWTPNMHSFLTLYRGWRPVKIDPGVQIKDSDLGGWTLRRAVAKFLAVPMEFLTTPFSWFGLGYEVVVIFKKPLASGPEA